MHVPFRVIEELLGQSKRQETKREQLRLLQEGSDAEIMVRWEDEI